MPFAITISSIITTNDNRFCFEIPRKNVANVYTIYTYSQRVWYEQWAMHKQLYKITKLNLIFALRIFGRAKFSATKPMMKIASIWWCWSEWGKRAERFYGLTVWIWSLLSVCFWYLYWCVQWPVTNDQDG